MTQLQNPLPPIGSQRNAPIPVPRQGIRASLIAPGVVPAPPVDRGAEMARQLMAVMGMAGAAIAQAGNMADREVARRERERAEIEQLYRGQASLHARTILPGIMQRIQNRELLVPDGMKVEDYAEQLINEQVADLPEPYAEQFRQILIPQLAAGFVAQQQQIIEEARAESLQLASEAAITAASADDIRRVLEASREFAPNLTDSERLDTIVVPALRSAVAAGDRVRFEAAVEALGGRFPGVVAQLRPQLEARIEQRRADAERQVWQQAQDFVASRLDQDAPNYDFIREQIDNLPLSPSQRLDLKMDVERHRASQESRRRQETRRQLEAIAQRNPSVESFRQSVQRIGGLSDTEAAAVVDDYVRRQIELAAQTGDIVRLQMLSGELSDEAGAQTFLAEQRQEALNRYRARRVESVLARVIAGEITGDEALRFARDGARRFGANPDDPSAIEPNQAAQIENAVRSRGSADLAMQQVAYKLQTGAGTLTESQHARALDRLIGPEGQGYLDATNAIADPDGLSSAILTAGITTPALRNTLIASLVRGTPDEAMAAARVIGRIGAADETIFARLTESAGEQIVPALEAARDLWQRGRLQNEATRLAALEEIRAALEIEIESRPRPEVVQDIERDGVRLPDLAEQVIEAARETYPQATDTFLLVDWLNPDPGLDAPNVGVHQQVQKWIADRFATLNQVRGVPREIALAKAQEYARGQFQQKFDLVRWNNTLTAQLIDDGRNPPLAADLRWGEDFEDEARQLLEEMGHDPDDIVAMKPLLDAPPDNQGWLYVTASGDVLTDDDGSLIVFQPSTMAKHRAEAFRRLLDRKARAFGHNTRIIRSALQSLATHHVEFRDVPVMPPQLTDDEAAAIVEAWESP